MKKSKKQLFIDELRKRAVDIITIPFAEFGVADTDSEEYHKVEEYESNGYKVISKQCTIATPQMCFILKDEDYDYISSKM